MTVRTKICGITNAADRDLAVDAGADALGFIVDVPVDTPREITAREAADLVDGVPPLVTAVLVTMPETPGDAVDLLAQTGADAVQVHGLDPGDVVAVRRMSGRPTVAAVDAAAPDEARRYDDAADALLVDSVDDSGAGGTGRTHDWEATRALRESVAAPVILAGGLTPDNVADAVTAVEPFGVDVASGVEADGGRKDPRAVRAFVANAARARGVTPR